MSVQSFGNIQAFYYIDPITSTNYFLDFDEGSGELTAEIPAGNYTMTELAQAVEDSLNSVGSNTYTVNFLRSDRKFQIVSDNNVTLKVASGTNFGTDVYGLIGFTGADLGPGTTFTGNVAAGSIYQAQFPAQDFIDSEDFQKAVSASINKSASGDVEVIRFGTEKFFEMNFMFITNIDQSTSGPVLTNLSGVTDARLFMRFCITKSPLEFMPNTNDRATFHKVLLEKTDEDSNGTGYKLKEMYTKNLPGYFETGVLRFRKIED